MNISAIQIFHKKSGITVGITMASYTPVEGFTFITFGESSRALIEAELEKNPEIISFGNAKGFKTFFEIEQSVHNGATWEPLDNGAFDTQPQAEAAMRELETNLGWRGLRVVQVIETDQAHWSGDVVATGLENDAEGVTHE